MTSWDRYDGGDNEPSLVASPLVFRDPSAIPPRPWLLGRMLLRGYFTLLSGAGATGKTALAITTALSVVTGRDLLGQHAHQTGPAWIITLEDDHDEMERRIHAAMLHHNIPRGEVEGRLYVNCGRDRPLIIAEPGDDGAVRFTDAAALEDEIRAREVVLLIPDPLVKLHRLEENSNVQMDAVITALDRITARTGCAGLAPHHTRKGANGWETNGDIDASRGASALAFGARINVMLTTMPAKAAAQFGVPADEAWQHIRLDDAKVNMAPRDKARWFKLHSVPLGNAAADPRYPDGDLVQVIDRWTPATPWTGLDHATLAAIFTAFRDGPEPGEFYNSSRLAVEKLRADRMVARLAGITDDQAGAVIATWIANEVLIKTEYTSRARHRKRVSGLMLDDAKAGPILAAMAPFGAPDD